MRIHVRHVTWRVVRPSNGQALGMAAREHLVTSDPTSAAGNIQQAIVEDLWLARSSAEP